MQTDVAQEIFRIVKILPEDTQKMILEQVEKIASSERPVSIWAESSNAAGTSQPRTGKKCPRTVRNSTNT